MHLFYKLHRFQNIIMITRQITLKIFIQHRLEKITERVFAMSIDYKKIFDGVWHNVVVVFFFFQPYDLPGFRAILTCQYYQGSLSQGKKLH